MMCSLIHHLWCLLFRLMLLPRFCYLGSIDDWIEIGPIDQLATLVKTYVKHLGQESFYELH
jgi:hypothetical protein